MKPMLMSMILGLGLVAQASDSRLYFRVDFPFTVSGQPLPAGDYQIDSQPEESNAVRLVHEGSGRTIYVNLPSSDVNRSGPRAYPTIAFRCDHASCAVAAVQNLKPGFVFRTWESLSPARNTHYRTVALNATPGK